MSTKEHTVFPETSKSTRRKTGFASALQSCFIIPQRYVIGIIGFLGVCNAYTMRVSLNMAITQMVNHTKAVSSKFDPEACPGDSVEGKNFTVVSNPYAIFDWDEKTQGFILSGFYYGYGVTQILGGYLSERYGGKWTLGVGLLSTAIFTFFTPVVTRAGGSTWLFILRVFQGIGEGPTMPGLMVILAKWVPPHERAIQGAIIFGGAQIGNVFGSVMTGYFLYGGKDWANVFYFFGGFGVVWFILWCLLVYSTPKDHPFISTDELEYLNKNVIAADEEASKDPVPWKAILRSVPIWALVAAAVGHDWGYYFLVTDLPKYSHEVLKFNIAATGTLTSLPYIAMWVSAFIFGFICDWCIRKNWHSIRTARIIYTTIAATGPAICCVLASYSGCNRTVAMAYFVFGMALMGGFYSGMKVNTLDLAPNHAGTIASLLNTISTFAGIVTPYLTGILTPDSTVSQWRVAFWVNFAMLVGTNVIYCIWVDGSQQWWDDVRQFGYPADWKHGLLTKKDLPAIKLETVRLTDDKENL